GSWKVTAFRVAHAGYHRVTWELDRVPPVPLLDPRVPADARAHTRRSAPTHRFVEPPRVVVVVEHPDHQRRHLLRAQPRGRALEHLDAEAVALRVVLEIDRVDLAGPRPGATARP